MGVEKAPGRVVRVRVGLRVLVVHAVVARPVENGALVSNAVRQHQEKAHAPVRLVGTVRPEAVHAAGDPEAADGPQDEREEEGQPLHVEAVLDAKQRRAVHEQHVNDHWPVHRLVLKVVPDRIESNL